MEERKEPEVKDVQKEAKQSYRSEQILKHKEGVSHSNITRQLRERKPDNQLFHSLYGQVRW